jgi:glycosyltransferase involved in cell wall biosynthesis
VLKSIALINSGLSKDNYRLQPWRYLFEVIVQLNRLGHPVTLFNNKDAGIPDLKGIREICLNSTSNPKWQANQTLVKALRRINPDVILWHVGLTSFFHQNFNVNLARPTLGIFTSPIYLCKDFNHLGLFKLVTGIPLSIMPVFGNLLPSPWIRKWMSNAFMDCLIVQTETTLLNLRKHQFWMKPIHVIPPGVDEVWRNNHSMTSEEVRRACGFAREDRIVVYFGPSTRLRGLPTLLKAFELARRYDESLRLLVLRRNNEGLFNPDRERIHRLDDRKKLPGTHIVDGFISQDELASYVAACNVVALPFELVPSDAPLSILEARALSKPLVTTKVACLPELAGNGAYLVSPGNPAELAGALLKAIKETERRRVPDQHLCEPQVINSWGRIGAAWSSIIQSL